VSLAYSRLLERLAFLLVLADLALEPEPSRVEQVASSIRAFIPVRCFMSSCYFASLYLPRLL
jgi:hypothetical protein